MNFLADEGVDRQIVERLHTHGVVLIRLAGLSPGRKAKLVASVVNQHTTELSCAFAVIAPGIVRIRRFGG